jgi:integrase/recombinase XerD
MKTRKAIAAFLAAKKDLSPRTLEQYTGALYYLQAACPGMPRKPQPLRDAMDRASTIWVRDSLWRSWSSFFHWCRREYNIINPMDLVDRPKLPAIDMKALEPVELARVLAAAGSILERAIIALALDAGLRASELGRLRIVDIGSETIWVWGKGRKRVKVPISPETRHLLQLLINQDGKDSNQALLFKDKRGEPLTRFAVYRMVRKCMDRAGIAGPKRGPHCLRHSLGTNYIAAGGDPFTLMRIMRHSNISTTQKYVNLAMRTVIEHHHRYSPLRDAIKGAQGVLLQESEEIQ